MDSRIHLSQIWKIMEERDLLGKPKHFSMQATGSESPEMNKNVQYVVL
jgi:hypothetical protein